MRRARGGRRPIPGPPVPDSVLDVLPQTIRCRLSSGGASRLPWSCAVEQSTLASRDLRNDLEFEHAISVEIVPYSGNRPPGLANVQWNVACQKEQGNGESLTHETPAFCRKPAAGSQLLLDSVRRRNRKLEHITGENQWGCRQNWRSGFREPAADHFRDFMLLGSAFSSKCGAARHGQAGMHGAN